MGSLLDSLLDQNIGKFVVIAQMLLRGKRFVPPCTFLSVSGGRNRLSFF
jgi:hypothetical protein